MVKPARFLALAESAKLKASSVLLSPTYALTVKEFLVPVSTAIRRLLRRCEIVQSISQSSGKRLLKLVTARAVSFRKIINNKAVGRDFNAETLRRRRLRGGNAGTFLRLRFSARRARRVAA